MIELALPAGKLDGAVAALSAGADAVYFGMKDFSARKGAVNFSLDDLAVIRRLSRSKGQKIYITVNTLVDDSDVTQAVRLLSDIAFYEPDGIIIQDLGLIDIVRRHFPSLPLHGSTQLAVHTIEGVKAMQDLGFERVVLSRELTLDEIAHIRDKCPDIQLKVFIHGALCYGFSGLCMASANVCGRSANRGECAQVCRTWFTERSSGRNGYFFSLEDLMAGQTLRKLDEIGIDSAKIEGRLKGNAYILALTRYYKAVLAGEATEKDSDMVATTFLRKSGQGYFDYHKGRPSLVAPYPSHLGLLCGKVVEQATSGLSIETSVPLQDHDGLQVIVMDGRGLPSAVKFPCRILSKRGRRTIVDWHGKEDLRGLDVYKISSADQNQKAVNTDLPRFQKPVDITLTIGQSALRASALDTTVEVDFQPSQARTPRDSKAQAEAIFRQSDRSRYTLATLTVDNETDLSAPFLPLSNLKELRRRLYQALDSLKTPPARLESFTESQGVELPKRSLLEGDLPWDLEPKVVDGRTFITLPPVTFDEEGLFNQVEDIMASHEKLYVGLNNIGQIRLAKKHPEHSYFADVYLYLANAWACDLLHNELGDNFVGGYLWMERQERKAPWPISPTPVEGWTPPSFISRSCFRHDSMGEPCSTCPGNSDYEIVQNNVAYSVKVRDCLTVVTKH